jgi:hypothetical protein
MIGTAIASPPRLFWLPRQGRQTEPKAPVARNFPPDPAQYRLECAFPAACGGVPAKTVALHRLMAGCKIDRALRKREAAG